MHDNVTLDGLTVKDLRDLLKRSGIDFKPSARKRDLREMVKSLQGSSQTDFAEPPVLVTLQGPTLNSTDAEDPLPSIPAMGDNIDHLLPGFDPKTLTVARLRNILMTHRVDYQRATRKQDLVYLFKTNIMPRAAATLRAMEEVRPSDEGITDV